MSEVEKVLRLHNSLCDDSSDSDCGSSERSIYLKLQQLYTTSKLPIEQNTDSDTSMRRNRKGKRKPTRKPDPNVYNRNALQARENRRKKKAQLESLENKLQKCEQANAMLLKSLKRQLKTTHRLEQQKLYYKNIVSNQTEIVELITALNGHLENTTPLDGNSNKVSPNQNSCNSSRECESLKLSYDFSDAESQKPFSLEEAWCDLLNENPLTDAIALPLNDENITNDLNFSSRIENDKRIFDQLTGICLHVAGGKVSLEFCPSCHWKSNGPLPVNILQGNYNDI